MMLRSVLLLTFSLSFPAMANDPVSAGESEHETVAQQEISTIVDLSGITGLGLQARNVAQKALNNLNANIGQQYDVVDRIASKWSPGVLEAQAAKILHNYSESDRQNMLVAFNDKYVKNAREKELSAIKEQGSSAYNDYVQRLRQQPPSAERVRRIQELDSAMHFSAYILKTREYVYPQVKAVFSSFNPPENWENKLRNDVLEFMLYVHRTTPNDELQHITDVYSEPKVQSFLSSVQAQLGS